MLLCKVFYKVYYIYNTYNKLHIIYKIKLSILKLKILNMFDFIILLMRNINICLFYSESDK